MYIHLSLGLPFAILILHCKRKMLFVSEKTFSRSCGKDIEFLVFVENSKYFTNKILKKKVVSTSSQSCHLDVYSLFTVESNPYLLYYFLCYINCIGIILQSFKPVRYISVKIPSRLG